MNPFNYLTKSIKWLTRLLSLITLVYIASGVALFFLQRSLIYFPSQAIKHNEKEVTLKNNGQPYKVIVAGVQKEKAIIYFGGNRETVARNITPYKNNFPNHAIYLINYRGYGGSEGSPTEENLFSDALHSFDYVASTHSHITVIGRSLGSGVAAHVASNRPVNKLVLVTPYDSIQNIAQVVFPYYPINFLLTDKFDSIKKVKTVTADTLVFIAETDSIIPKQHTQNLIKHFLQTKPQVTTIKGSGHHDIASFEDYFQTLKLFLK